VKAPRRCGNGDLPYLHIAKRALTLECCRFRGGPGKSPAASSEGEGGRFSGRGKAYIKAQKAGLKNAKHPWSAHPQSFPIIGRPPVGGIHQRLGAAAHRVDLCIKMAGLPAFLPSCQPIRRLGSSGAYGRAGKQDAPIQLAAGNAAVIRRAGGGRSGDGAAVNWRGAGVFLKGSPTSHLRKM
jgi:hypothetical protein